MSNRNLELARSKVAEFRRKAKENGRLTQAKINGDGTGRSLTLIPLTVSHQKFSLLSWIRDGMRKWIDSH